MTTILTLVIAFFLGAEIAMPGRNLDVANQSWAIGVDSGDSCWDRIGGEPETYVTPHHFSLDPTCNYKIADWRLVRK